MAVTDHIIAGCKKQDRASQKELYMQCYEQMMQVCMMYNQNADDAAACLNEAMYTVFSKIDRYNASGKIEAWIRRIVVNTCLNRIRRDTRFTHQALEYAEDNESAHDALQKLHAKELYSMVYSLPKTHSSVLLLFAVEGYKHDEIAQILDITPGTSRWYLNDARKKMKAMLQYSYQNEIHKNV